MKSIGHADQAKKRRRPLAVDEPKGRERTTLTAAMFEQEMDVEVVARDHDVARQPAEADLVVTFGHVLAFRERKAVKR
jgi:hypothetical protein